MSSDVLCQSLNHIIEMIFGQPRIHADPERPVHHEIAVVERSDDPIISILHVGLAKQVAAEQKTSSDLFVVIEKTQHVFSIERRVGAKRHAETEPGRLAVFGCDRQHEHVFEMLQSVPQILPVPPARRDELVQPLQLGKTDRRLHVGNFQIIAEMRISVFVIVSERQFAELPAKPLLAGVVLARLAITVPAPIPESIPRFA